MKKRQNKIAKLIYIVLILGILISLLLYNSSQDIQYIYANF